MDRVLERYAAQLPLTIRQVWYSLISDGVLVKEERTYKQTVEARRSGRIPWETLRDDTGIRAEPVAYEGPDGFRAGLRRAALDYRLDRQAGQPVRLEIVCETAGMVPQLGAVADCTACRCIRAAASTGCRRSGEQRCVRLLTGIAR
ncbi:hypothetical protein OG612_44700 (plasmid) [Streptomyces sp. NBC_01527]|uniref:hypothetical protein n=1 Tax=unclassified Streptomyces TaxID=2593676 RepID=UPI002E1075D4|nr:hypothetical protein OG763_43520 [Streptomyces sp. NBC_01230]